MLLFQALHYPFQGKDWFRRLVTLTLLQLLPLVGQLILLGYGLDIVRAVYAGHSSLPPLRWLPALGDGFRFLLAGFCYLLPILITGTIVGARSIGSSGNFGNPGIIGILLSIGLPLLLFLIRMVSVGRTSSSSIQPSGTRGSSLRLFMTGILPVFVTVLAILILAALVSSSGIETGKPNGLSILLLVVLALLLFFIRIVLSIGAVRYATEHKGLFTPMTNARLLLQNRALAGMLFLNVLLLDVITVTATIVGLVLFILPGLFVFVVCTLALWYVFVRYRMLIEIKAPTPAREKSTVALLKDTSDITH